MYEATKFDQTEYKYSKFKSAMSDEKQFKNPTIKSDQIECSFTKF